MFDYTKMTVKQEQIDDMVEKTKIIATKTVEFNNTMFKESLKFFNDVTDKYFYTYTSKVAEASEKGTEYAKEFIKTGQVKSLFANSGKN